MSLIKKCVIFRASGFGYLLWYRCKVCNSIPVPKQVLIPDTLIWHLVWYCWYDTRSKAMLWYLIFLFWSVWYLRTRTSKVFFLLVFVFYDKKKVNKTTIFVVLFRKSLRLHSSLSQETSLSVLVFKKQKHFHLSKKSINNTQKKIKLL